MSSPEVETAKFEHGFTWRSVLAIIYGATLLYPVVMYMGLVTGIGINVVFLAVILFSEVARFFGRSLTKQEVYIMYIFVGWASTSTFMLDTVVRAQFFMTDPRSLGFIDPYTKLPLPFAMPWWFAPPYGDSSYAIRTIFQMSWAAPVLLAIARTLLWFMTELSLASLFGKIYLEEEKLPFPFQQVDAEICVTLAEREPERLRYFTIFAFIGLIWGTFVYALPMISSNIFGIEYSVVPLPYVDLTKSLMNLGIKGAVLTISPEITAYALGFMLSLSISIPLLLGSLVAGILVNWAALNVFPTVFPDWAASWSAGFVPDAALAMQRGLLTIWFGPLIGIGLAISTLGILKVRKTLPAAIRRLSNVSTAGGYFSLPVTLGMFFFGTIGGLFLFWYMVPDASVQLLSLSALLSIFWSIVFAAVNIRAIGETGYGISVPFIWQATIVASGYPKLDAWVTEPVIGGTGASNFVAQLKVAYLTETKPRDYFLGILVMIPFTWLASAFWVSVFWSLAPIPSSAYPNTALTWPLWLTGQAVWWSRELSTFRPDLVALSYILFLVLGLLSNFMNGIGIPFSFISFVTGLTGYAGGLMHLQIAAFFGSLIANLIVIPRMGKDWYRTHRSSIIAGLITGEAVSIAIVAALVMAYKALWILPY
jgi:hypothetical protein